MYSQPDFYGSKYTGYQPAADVAKKVRADFKAAQAAGEIPADIKFSVVSDYFSGGQAVRVTIQGRPESEVYYQETVSYPAGFDRSERRMHPEAKTIEEKVRKIANTYNRDRSDSMVDYFDVMYYCDVSWESDWARKYREAQAGKRAAARQAKVQQAA